MGDDGNSLYHFDMRPDVGLKTECCEATVRGKRWIVVRCPNCGRYAKVLKPDEQTDEKETSS